MPKLFDAYARHANCYLVVAEKAAELFVRESTQTKGIAIFDDNRGQIEAAQEWVEQQEVTRERDLVMASFVDALSAPGMLRFSIRDKLIPLLEKRISIAQRLSERHGPMHMMIWESSMLILATIEKPLNFCKGRRHCPKHRTRTCSMTYKAFGACPQATQGQSEVSEYLPVSLGLFSDEAVDCPD
jgi:hypothetical protein